MVPTVEVALMIHLSSNEYTGNETINNVFTKQR